MGGGVGETIGTCSRGGGEGNIKQYIDLKKKTDVIPFSMMPRV